jgi:copper(I)-binding protein
MNITTSRLLATAAVALLALTGCSTTTPAATTESTQSANAANAFTITDAWVKTAESGMSAAFGTLENSGSTDVTVASVTSAASDMIQLHETVANDAGEMVMQEKDGGFVIPAGGSYELAPGGNHIMLMGLAAPIVAGDELTFTVTFSDGSTVDFTAPAKDYSGANETYEEGTESDMNMEMSE